MTLIQAVTEQLFGLIRDGHLEPGDTLPSERELMERLQVGRSSVREALRSLATIRVIEVRPVPGAFVRTPITEDLVPSETLRLMIKRDAMIEIVEAREVLEEESLAGHQHIYACIRSGNAPCAADAMRQHLSEVRRQVQRSE